MKKNLLLLIMILAFNVCYSQNDSIMTQTEKVDTAISKFATDSSIVKLKKILTMSSGVPRNRVWSPAAHSNCRVTAIESINPQTLSINNTITKLSYQFTCIRDKASYNCGGGWTPGKNDTYNSILTADLNYINGVLYITNIKISPDRSDAETNCQIDIVNHIKSFSGIVIDLTFKDMPK